MRKEGVERKEVARRFKLSPSRIYLIQKQDAADRSMGERRARQREEIRNADDPDKQWPVKDLVDALGLLGRTDSCWRRRPLSEFQIHGVR